MDSSRTVDGEREFLMAIQGERERGRKGHYERRNRRREGRRWNSHWIH
jgi:hypothetical protein